MLAYLEDGPHLIALAMNGWADGEPSWWLNLQEHAEATVDVAGGSYVVQAHAARGAERERLWSRWQEMYPELDSYAALRSTETALVVLEPRPEPRRLLS